VRLMMIQTGKRYETLPADCTSKRVIAAGVIDTVHFYAEWVRMQLAMPYYHVATKAAHAQGLHWVILLSATNDWPHRLTLRPLGQKPQMGPRNLLAGWRACHRGQSRAYAGASDSKSTGKTPGFPPLLPRSATITQVPRPLDF